MKMNSYSRYICLMAVTGLLQAANAADITGKITLKGTPPPEVTLPFDPSCGKLHTQKQTTQFFVVGSGGELADVFVYIKEGAKPTPAPAQPAVLDQKGCIYTPYIFGLQTQQKLSQK